MATQLKDGKWTETKALYEALLDFNTASSAGIAKRFVVDTNRDVKKEKAAIVIEEELMPCPFCGNPGTISMDAKWWIIECQGPCDMLGVSTGQYDDLEACVDAWNTRTEGPKNEKDDD